MNSLFAREKKIARRNHELGGESNSLSDENLAFAARFRPENQIGEKSGRHRTVGQSRKNTSQEFSPRSVGCPRQENVSRSICRVRKSYPRGYFFAPDLR
jgi:hypothetical protein